MGDPWRVRRLMAKGSSSSYAGWESLTCARCNRKIVKSGPNAFGAMFSFEPRYTLCGPCIPLGRLVRAA